MNSADQEHPDDAVKEGFPSGSQASDDNANVRMAADESKGAIPKTKFQKIMPKKPNNNLEDVTTYGNDVLKRNGFKKSTLSVGNYLNNPYADGDVDRPDCVKDLCRTAVTFKEATAPSVVVAAENDSYVPLSSNNCRACDDDYREECCKDSDSSSESELLSISDDGCIYTYKGDHDQVADLPSSFFNLEIPLVDDPLPEGREGNSSPEMDFLEMDFDPGPSGDADSDSISNAEIDNAASLPLDSLSLSVDSKPPAVPNKEEEAAPPCSLKNPSEGKQRPPELTPQDLHQSKYLNVIKTVLPKPAAVVNNSPVIGSDIKMPWSCSISERTRAGKYLRVIKKHLGAKGDVCSPNETVYNGDAAPSNNFMCDAADKEQLDYRHPLWGQEKIMIWSEREASIKQITQVGPSACGATAVFNVLNALRLPIPTLERVQETVKTRLRANHKPLTEYLLSRSSAGCSHREIIASLYELSNRRIYARFFAMYPERVVNLPRWLGYWIKNGAVPVATLNLQKCDGNLPDSWHHQMIHGVGPKSIYMTNPLECVDPGQLWPQLSSESVLMVRREDVLTRWNPKEDFLKLQGVDDVRWKEHNVIGQLAKIVRESRRASRSDVARTSHIRIPADYRAGITLAIDFNSPAFQLLHQCPELPLLQPEDTASAL